MNRRPLLALLLAIAALGPIPGLSPPAWAAEEEKDDGDDVGNGSDGGEDDSGGDIGSDDGDAVDGGAAGDDGDAEDSGRAGVERQSGDHDEALRAVSDNGALPLSRMLALFGRRFDGKVVDVTLIRSSDELRYRIKFIDSAGRVRHTYFDAVSGALVR